MALQPIKKLTKGDDKRTMMVTDVANAVIARLNALTGITIAPDGIAQIDITEDKAVFTFKLALQQVAVCVQNSDGSYSNKMMFVLGTAPK